MAKTILTEIDRARQLQQLEINNRWLLSKFDEIQDLLCPDALGTWQKRVEACVRAAKKLSKPCTLAKTQLRSQAEDVIAFLNTTCGSTFKAKGASLQLTMARLRESDVTVEGVKQMIRRQHAKWGGTDMEEYLRPSTLFRASHFVNYYAAKDLALDHKPQVKRSFGDLCYDS